MPVNLLNFSLPVAPLSTMNLHPSTRPSYRVIPIFSQIFPHKPEYQSLSRTLGIPVLLAHQQSHPVRPFSTLRVRPRPGSNSVARAFKGLLDDESELGDRVSRLSRNSVGTRDDHDGDNNVSVSSARRRRDGDSGGYEKSNRQMGRDSFGAFSRNSIGKGKFGTGMEEENEGFVGRRRENDRGRDERDERVRISSARRGRDSYSGRGNLRGMWGGGERMIGVGMGEMRGLGFPRQEEEEIAIQREGESEGYVGRRREDGGQMRENNRVRVSSARRGGDSYSGDHEKANRRMGKDSFGSFSTNSRGKPNFGGEWEGGNEGFVGRRRENSGQSRDKRDGRVRVSSERRGRDNYSGDHEKSNRRMGNDLFGSFSSHSMGTANFGGELDGGTEGLVGRRRENDGRMGDDWGGGLEKGGENLGKIGFSTSNGGIGEYDVEEREENLMQSFRDLISVEDSVEANLISEEHSGEREENLMQSFRDLISQEDSEEDGDDGVGDSMLKNVDFFVCISQGRFDQCSVSPLSLKGIKDAGYEKMTLVQEATLPVILKGKDVLAKAKTGTGKTVAFLLPSIEVVVKSPSVGHYQKLPPILVLVICPTRELASQAAVEGNTLLKYHPSISVQVVIGGTSLPQEQKRMQANPCQNALNGPNQNPGTAWNILFRKKTGTNKVEFFTVRFPVSFGSLGKFQFISILVATPGRLRDHIENTAGFSTRLMGVKVLVLDEADHLLDMGFRKDIEKIIAAVPKERQTLLFSATVPEEVRQICHMALKRDHEFIDIVGEGSEETHTQVRQTYLIAPLDKHFSLLHVLLEEHISSDVDYKVLIFCTTAMVTKLVADLLGQLNLNVREIHSRKTQSYRTRVSDEFRKSKGLVLVTSDVSARGVDYPDVTLVIQVGLPADREQYIHRLGRTGRKGKEGKGILLLAPWEEFFLSAIKDLPITKVPVPSVDPETRKKVERALSLVEMKNKEAAYQAWLGYYNSNKNVGQDKQRLVELANEFSRCMGLDNPPAIRKLVLGKMGLRNVPGLYSK
ncbi:P-loop containing nucleoside triphosphate hydrolases superfamily protein [Actinidia rufa]|uniref:ATP-dependent RNA helicase n=1 Tax=Actinidia rufa TaxID=165716 RepID=A0A7J0EUS6_9ERIC|nr:P-loop containing nucleoside triphosphate hydrolases superfamily protein [Actinidia rufa]